MWNGHLKAIWRYLEVSKDESRTVFLVENGLSSEAVVQMGSHLRADSWDNHLPYGLYGHKDQKPIDMDYHAYNSLVMGYTKNMGTIRVFKRKIEFQFRSDHLVVGSCLASHIKKNRIIATHFFLKQFQVVCNTFSSLYFISTPSRLLLDMIKGQNIRFSCRTIQKDME